MRKEKDSSIAEDDIFQKEIPSFQLKLFVTGASPNSARAIANLKIICEKYLNEKYELEIIDVYQQPLKTTGIQVIALPMLLKSLPLPVKKLIGDLSDTSKVLKGLGLNP